MEKEEIVKAAQMEMQGWRNGHSRSSTTPAPEYRNDMGQQVYRDPGRAGVEISLPHILNVAFSGPLPTPPFVQINLFGAVRNYNAVNNGNVGTITVTYISNNPLVPFQYSDLLGSTLAEPMQVGIIRIQTVTTSQANAPIALLRNPGVGKFEGLSVFPLIYPNQFINNIAYVEQAFKVDKYMYISYLQNVKTDPAIQMYFYQNANISLDRAFSNQPVVSNYAKPQTGISTQTTTTIVAPSAASGAGVRSGSLL